MDPSAALWNIELFGGLRARSGDRVLERFQTQKTAALFAYLAFDLSRRRSREELVDLLWPDADLDAGRNRLSQAIGWLRTQLETADTGRGSVVIADRQYVSLNPDSVVTDAAQFERHLQAATGQDAALNIENLAAAVALYQGDLLAGHYEDWIIGERQRFLNLFLDATRRLVQHYQSRKEFEKALEYARRSLAVDPLSEELHCDLMRLLAACGQTAMAIRQYRELERVLARELNETPSKPARDLIEEIRHMRSEPAAAPAEPRTGTAFLPVSLTRFFGRDEEIAHVQNLFRGEGARLVTLVGTGGAGKTRLALEAAGRLSKMYEGGVWFLPLADLTDSAMIPVALCDLLQLPRSAAKPAVEQIVDALSGRQALIVIDNAEHMIDGAGEIVSQLLGRLPLLNLLVTSRQKLNVEGEREAPVPPLPAPAGTMLDSIKPITVEALMKIDSVRLFVDRAQAVRPSFAVTRENAATVARVCERLEGIPLAIELCAAWAQTLTPAQMLEQLNHRFELLVSRRRDIAPRHRTLRAALEYNYLQLPAQLQQLFVRLSVFRGGWTLEAAAAVCPDEQSTSNVMQTLDAITELRERSLIVAEESRDRAGSEEMRYRMLETLREFAAEQRPIALEAVIRRRHAAYFETLAATAGPEMAGPDQPIWLSRVEADHDNFRAALGWTLEAGEIETGLRMASALAPFWEVRGYTVEGQTWIERILATDDATASKDIRLRAKALNACASMARGRSDFAGAQSAAGKALELWREIDDDTGMATSLQILATMAYFREDYEGAKRYLHEALERSRRLNNSILVGSALLNLGNIAMEERDWQTAWDLYSESLACRREEGNIKRVADALNNLGLVARYRGEYENALTYLRESLVICRNIADRSGTAITLLNLGTVYRLSGRFDETRNALTEAAAISQEVNNNRVLAWCVKETGHFACAQGDFRHGIAYLSSSENLRTILGMTYNPADPEELDRDTAQGRSALTEAEYAQAWIEGRLWSFEEAYRRVMQR